MEGASDKKALSGRALDACVRGRPGLNSRLGRWRNRVGREVHGPSTPALSSLRAENSLLFGSCATNAACRHGVFRGWADGHTSGFRKRAEWRDDRLGGRGAA